MASSESPSIIDEYTQTFTSLHAGKRELIQSGADAVALNRFIIDAANATDEPDVESVLQAIDCSRVTHGETDQERMAYCDRTLRQLITLQEQVVVIQKSAREKGISGGLLTIIGQAANQSPDDNGASILRQLSQLVRGEEPDTATTESSDPAGISPAGISLEGPAANDTDRRNSEPVTGLQLATHTLRLHWRPFAMDAVVCALACGIAISLIN